MDVVKVREEELEREQAQKLVVKKVTVKKGEPYDKST